MTTEATQETTKAARENVVKIDGKQKTWPNRLDGVEVVFPSIAPDASPEEAFQVLRGLGSGAAVTHFIVSNLESAQAGDLKGFLNGKAREPGKTYTRDEIKKLPTRSEKLSKEDVAAFGTDWKLSEPRTGGTAAKLSAAEAKARQSEAEKAAAIEALIGTVRALAKADKKAAQKQLESLIGMGMLPADTTL